MHLEPDNDGQMIMTMDIRTTTDDDGHLEPDNDGKKWRLFISRLIIHINERKTTVVQQLKMALFVCNVQSLFRRLTLSLASSAQLEVLQKACLVFFTFITTKLHVYFICFCQRTLVTYTINIFHARITNRIRLHYKVVAFDSMRCKICESNELNDALTHTWPP